MFQIFKKKSQGITLVEIMIGVSIFMSIMMLFTRWLFFQKEYQKRIWKVSEIQDSFRRANWKMIQEIQRARAIIWPRMNPDQSIKTDVKVVFKNFDGDYIAFYHDQASQEIRRCFIPNGIGNPVVDTAPLSGGIASASFTAGSQDNRLLSIHMSTEGVHSLDAVFLLNSD